MPEIIPAIESFAKVSKSRLVVFWHPVTEPHRFPTPKGAFATAAGLSTIGPSQACHTATFHSTHLQNRSRLALVWPELSHLPSVFPRRIEDKCVSPGSCISPPDELIKYLDVPVPTQYDLPYEDLTLVTRDEVKIRCYLLMQRKELNLAAKPTFESLQETEDPPEKVESVLGFYFRRADGHGHSSLPRGQQLSCSTETAVTWGIAYHSRRFSMSRCGAT